MNVAGKQLLWLSRRGEVCYLAPRRAGSLVHEWLHLARQVGYQRFGLAYSYRWIGVDEAGHYTTFTTFTASYTRWMSRMSPSNFSIPILTLSFFKSSPISARRVSTSSTINSLPISLNLSFFALSTFCGCIGIMLSLIYLYVQNQWRYLNWCPDIAQGINRLR